MAERRGAYRILMGRLEGRDHLEDSGIDGKIILKWMFKKWDEGYGLDYCEGSNEPRGSIKCGEFLD